MSFSSIRINISTKDIKKLCPIDYNIDTYNILPYVTKNFLDEKIIQSMVLDRKSTYLSSLVFTEQISFMRRDVILYISYHHSSDPDLFDVIVETGRYLKEIGLKYWEL